MKKVYVVSQGEYSDYDIVGIFDNKSLANKFMESFGGSERFNEIEEHKVNPYEPEVSKGYKPYFLRMSKTGEAYDIEVTKHTHRFGRAYISYGYSFDNHLYNYCFARDEKHAIKITNDLRRKLIANNQWPKKV